MELFLLSTLTLLALVIESLTVKLLILLSVCYLKSKNHHGKTWILLNAPNVLKHIVLEILTFTKLKLGLLPMTLFLNCEELMQYFYELKINPFDVINVIFWGFFFSLVLFLIKQNWWFSKHMSLFLSFLVRNSYGALMRDAIQETCDRHLAF